MVAVPEAAGVNTPEDVIAPSVAAQETPVLYPPVPETVAVQADVWVVRMEEGEQLTVTEAIVTGTAVTVTLAEPVLVESAVEIAVIVSDPEAGTIAGAVYIPELEIVPETADHVTAEL